MNKIKILYDVVKTMKEKDVFKGTLQTEGTKDNAKVFSFDNAFERNNLTGRTKAHTNSEVDCDGKKMKLENSIDFEMPGCPGPHSFMRHMHAHSMHAHHGAGSGGIKEVLDKIAAVLGILNNSQMEEQEDGSVVLSLELADIPKDIRKLHEKMHHEHPHPENMQENHHHHALFMKEFHSMEKTDFNFKAFINKNREIEKIVLQVAGKQKDEKDAGHDMKLAAELCLHW